MPYQQPQTFPPHNPSFVPPASAQYPPHQGYPPQQQYQPPSNPNFAPPQFHNGIQGSFQGGPPRAFGAGSPPIPFHQQSHYQPPRTQTPPQGGVAQRSGSLPSAVGLPQRPSFGAPPVNAFQMHQMHQGQLPGPTNPLPALQATQNNRYGSPLQDGSAFGVSQNGGPPKQVSQAQNGSGNGFSTSHLQVPQEAQDKSPTYAISQAPIVANEPKTTEPAHEAPVEAKSGDVPVEKRPKKDKEKEKEIKLVYSDNETSPEEKMAKLSRYAFVPNQ